MVFPALAHPRDRSGIAGSASTAMTLPTPTIGALWWRPAGVATVSPIERPRWAVRGVLAWL